MLTNFDWRGDKTLPWTYALFFMMAALFIGEVLPVVVGIFGGHFGVCDAKEPIIKSLGDFGVVLIIYFVLSILFWVLYRYVNWRVVIAFGLVLAFLLERYAYPGDPGSVSIKNTISVETVLMLVIVYLLVFLLPYFVFQEIRRKWQEHGIAISLIILLLLNILGLGFTAYAMAEKGMFPYDKYYQENIEKCWSEVGNGTESLSPQNLQQNQAKQLNLELCPDGVCDDFEMKEGFCREDCASVPGWVEKKRGNASQGPANPPFEPSSSQSEISVIATNASYKKVSSKPSSGWFKTGQDADLMLSGIDFNNAGGPLLFNHPENIASDGTRLLLADRNNNRILVWKTLPSGNTSPDLVLGQENFSSNDPGTGLDELNWPVSVATAKGKVIVADSYNDRLLIWNSFPTESGQAADIEISDSGEKSLGDRSQDLAGAKRKMGWPWAVWTDGEKVVVAAAGSASVLIWNSFPTRNNQPADIVLFTGEDFGTPRSIGTDGKRLMIGDHNAKPNNGGSGNFFWKTFPTRDDQPYDFFVFTPQRMNEKVMPLQEGPGQKIQGDVMWGGSVHSRRKIHSDKQQALHLGFLP